MGFIKDSKSLNHQQELLVTRYFEHPVHDLCRSGQLFSKIVLNARISPHFAEPFKKRILLPSLRDLNLLGIELDTAIKVRMIEVCCNDRHV